MIGWRRLYPKPAGSLPGGIVTQWGVGIITILVLVFLTYWIYFGGGKEAELAPGTETEQGAARSFADQMAAQVEAESLRAESRRAAAERALQQQGRQQRQQGASGGGIGAGRVSVDEAMLLAGPSPDTGQPYTEEEWELRERLRLEALERRSRSLRSSPVAQTYRQVDRAAAETEARRAETASPADAMRAEGAAALEQALDTIGTVTTGLQDEVAAEAQADRAFIEALRGTPTATATPAVPTASAGPPPARDYSSPARVGAPDDPPGWERIHEGSFLEAALVTQLSGDFPGPVLAVVSVPFYSADRQRILVPRGTRVIGTAQAVSNQDQARLAVSFHRLIYPDGRWVSLAISRAQSTRRGSPERSSQPPLLFHVRRCRGGRHPGRTHGARRQPLRGRRGGLPGRCRAGTRTKRHPNLAAFLESFTHHHHSRRASASRLVHFRRAGAPAHKRRLK